MRLTSIRFLLVAGLGIHNLQAEILNFRKLKIKEAVTNSVLPSPEKEFKKELTVLKEITNYTTETIPKPNTPPIPEKEKVTIPLPAPTDPARPQTKQPSQFTRPFTQKLLTTVNFSPNPENPHKGVVFSPLEIGSVLSSMEGRVVAIDYMDGYYNYVIIEHPNGYFTVYGNLDAVYVAEGQTVKKGEALGSLVKEKGLYFQVNQGKKTLDPLSLIKS